MDNKSTTKRMIGAVVLVLIAALLLAWLLKGKNPKLQQNQVATAQQPQQVQVITGFPGVADPNQLPPAPNGPSAPPALIADAQQTAANSAQPSLLTGGTSVPAPAAPVAAPNADLQTATAPTPDNVTTFEIRPGETRAAIDKNGNVVETTGSLGGDTITENTAGTTASLPDENQPAPKTAVTNIEPAATSAPKASTQTAQAVAPEAATQPKSLAETAQGAAQGAATATQAAASKAATATTQAAKDAKEVLVAKPNPAATTAQAPEGQNRAVTLSSTTTAQVRPAPQPRLVNERPVPESAVKAQQAAQAKAAAERAAAEAAAKAQKPATTNGTTVAKAPDNKSATPAQVPSVNTLTADAAKRNGYVIQVLATADRAKADTIRQTIATDGYPAFIVHGVVNGKPVYRVRIGTFKAKADAVSVQSRLKVRYGQNQLVQNSFVTNNN